MSGGPTAKNGFRYQDWCAVYFTLESIETNATFEYLFCEQEKMDFELWGASNFTGYQIKTNPSRLSARETNDVLLYYLKKSASSQKASNLFRFVFAQDLSGSLSHLFSNIRGNSRGIRYAPSVRKFIDGALKGINLKLLEIDYHFYSETQIKRMVFSIAAETLKKELGTGADIPTSVVNSFVTRLRDEIDRISCIPSDADRIYTVEQVRNLIADFLLGVRIIGLRKEGQRSVKLKLEPQVASRSTKSKLTRNARPRIFQDRDGEALNA